MTGCENGCGKVVSFSQLRRDIRQAESKNLLQNIPPEMLMAVGVKESRGNRWFRQTDLQFRENMVVAMRETHLTQAEIIALTNPFKALYEKDLQKFRYETSWKVSVDKAMWEHSEPEAWRVLLHMSFGYFQKGLVWHLSPNPGVEWDSAYKKLLYDPLEQIRVCANDLHHLIYAAGGDLPLAFTKYNAGPNAKIVSEYGKQVFGLYQGFANESAKETGI